jgi:hypothetical protein
LFSDCLCCAHVVSAAEQVPAVTKEERLVFSIHNGDAFPASEDAVAPERIQDVRLIGAGVTVAITDFQRFGKALHAVVPVEQEGAHWLAIRTKPNFLQLEGPKFEQYLRDEGLEHAIEWRAQHGESANQVRSGIPLRSRSSSVAPDDGWSRTICRSNSCRSRSFAFTPGATLPVRVLCGVNQRPE